MTVSPTIPCQLLTMERKCQTTIVTRTLSTVVLMTTPATRRLRMERSASTITTCASQTSAWMTWISVDSACSHLIAKMRISSVPPIIYARRLRETLETHAQMTASVTRAHAIEMAIAQVISPMERNASVLTSVNQEYVNFSFVDLLLVPLILDCQMMKKIKQP